VEPVKIFLDPLFRSLPIGIAGVLFGNPGKKYFPGKVMPERLSKGILVCLRTRVSGRG